MKYFVVFLLSVMTPIAAYCCDCRKISKEESVQKSDFICIGTIIGIEDAYFKIKAIEYLKGNLKDTLIAIIDECSVHPFEKDKWLFYGEILDEQNVYISQCSWSRSFKRPFNVNSINVPSPPSPAAPQSILVLNEKLNLQMAVYELQSDILDLRTKKIETDIKKINIINKIYLIGLICTLFIILLLILRKRFV